MKSISQKGGFLLTCAGGLLAMLSNTAIRHLPPSEEPLHCLLFFLCWLGTGVGLFTGLAGSIIVGRHARQGDGPKRDGESPT